MHFFNSYLGENDVSLACSLVGHPHHVSKKVMGRVMHMCHSIKAGLFFLELALEKCQNMQMNIWGL